MREWRRPQAAFGHLGLAAVFILNRRVGAAAAGSGEGGFYWFKVGFVGMVVSGEGF